MSVFDPSVLRYSCSPLNEVYLSFASSSIHSSLNRETKIFHEKLLLMNLHKEVEKPSFIENQSLAKKVSFDKKKHFEFSLHDLFKHHFSLSAIEDRDAKEALDFKGRYPAFAVINHLKEMLLDTLDIDDLRFTFQALAECAARDRFTETSKVYQDQAALLGQLDIVFQTEASETFWTLACEFEELNDYEKAEFYYQKVFSFQITDDRKWIKYANFYRSLNRNRSVIQILQKGMLVCPNSKPLLENLLFFLLGRQKNREIRQIFLQLKEKGLFQDKWFEIELLEAELEWRMGNTFEARKKFIQCLNQKPLHPNAIKKYCQFEAALGNTAVSLSVILNFLQQQPEMVDFWNIALELREKHACEFLSLFPYLRYAMEEYKAINALFKAAHPFFQGVNCSLLSTKRMETELRFLVFCNSFVKFFPYNRKIFDFAFNSVPRKDKWKILVERAKAELLVRQNCREVGFTCILISKFNYLNDPEAHLQVSLLNECIGRFDLALVGLSKTFNQVYAYKDKLSKFAPLLINYKMRTNQIRHAKEKALAMIAKFPNDGRFWQLLLQASYHIGQDEQIEALFIKAFKQVHGSAELNCEYARFLLNPLCSYFDLEKAEHFLQAAVNYDPSYGDSYIELIRLKIISEGETADLSSIKIKYLAANPLRGELWKMSSSFQLMNPPQIFDFATKQVRENYMLFRNYYKRCPGAFISNQFGETRYSDFRSLAYLALTAAYALNNRSFHRIREISRVSLIEKNKWILYANN